MRFWSESDQFLHWPAAPGIRWSMSWRRLGRDVPEEEPILVCYGDLAVVALAFPADYYCPEMTFMDARTFDILPLPSHWMPLPARPRPDWATGRDASVSRRAA